MNKPNYTSPAVSAALQKGGVVLFSGGENPFAAGTGAVLTVLIDVLSKSRFSHSAVLPPGSADIFESTIESGVSGPQQRNLATTVADYGKGGGHAWIFSFLPQFSPNWDTLEATAEKMISERVAGKLPYDVNRLFKDAEDRSWVFDLVCLPADGIVEYLGAHSKGVVCSEMVGLLLQGGGVVPKLIAAGIPWLPKVNPAGQPIGCAPQDIADMPMFAPPVQLV